MRASLAQEGASLSHSLLIFPARGVNPFERFLPTWKLVEACMFFRVFLLPEVVEVSLARWARVVMCLAMLLLAGLLVVLTWRLLKQNHPTGSKFGFSLPPIREVDTVIFRDFGRRVDGKRSNHLDNCSVDPGFASFWLINRGNASSSPSDRRQPSVGHLAVGLIVIVPFKP